MNEQELSLPAECVLRKAKETDKWKILKIVQEFILTEALEFELRLLGFRFLIVLGLSLLLLLQIWLVLIDSSLRLGLILTSVYTALMVFSQTLYLFTLIIFPFIEPLINWQRYWVVEYNQLLVACVALNSYSTHSELCYLFVKSAWRSQGIGSYLVKHIIQEAAPPLYLVCKPKLLQFYTLMGFLQIPWENLPGIIKSNFNIFRPHFKLTGYPLFIMEHQRNKN